MNKYINYRPEIDGLRAIAVLSVIFYHSTLQLFDEKFLAGGFIGVDIFFVISGYLISKIIYNEIEKTKKFSYINFFKRRIRRIVPALFFVIIITFPFTYFAAMPNFFVDYAKSVISIVFFVSNFFFWNTSLAYDAIQFIQFQPFLHAWTLSLEEQFYLIFPFVFILILKKFKKYSFQFIIFGFILSLLLADYMSYTHASVNFYSLPTRAWEFLSGTIIILLEKRKLFINIRKEIKFFFIIFGLGLIIFSFIYLEDSMYLPSIVSLIPVIGTCMIILFSYKNNIIVKILSNDIFRAVGLISYSLYLWHYPIFIIFSKLNFLVQIVIIFLLSLVSYFFIEKKFRKKSYSKFYSLKTILFSGFVIIIVHSISIYFKKNHNYENFPEIVKNTLIERKIIKVDQRLKKEKKYNPVKKDVYIVGDSHTFVLWKAMLKNKNLENFNLISQNLSEGCYYVKGFDKINYFTKKKSEICNVSNQEKRRSNFLRKDDTTVIIGGRLPLYLNGENLKVSRYKDKKKSTVPNNIFYNKDDISLSDGIKESVMELLQNNVKVIIVYPVPILDFDPPKKIYDLYINDKDNFKKNLKKSNLTQDYKLFLKSAEKSHKLLNSIQHPNLFKIYTHNFLCNETLNLCSTHNENALFYRDNNHLSLQGNNLIIPQIIEYLNQ